MPESSGTSMQAQQHDSCLIELSAIGAAAASAHSRCCILQVCCCSRGTLSHWALRCCCITMGATSRGHCGSCMVLDDHTAPTLSRSKSAAGSCLCLQGSKTPARLPVAVETFLQGEGVKYSRPEPGLLQLAL